MTELDLPRLTSPWMLVAFEGWNDAADSATAVIDHLIERWGAEFAGEMDPQSYYDFQVNRPRVEQDESGRRRISWPTTRWYVARPADSEVDVLLVRGIEPNLRWRSYVEELLALAEVSGAQAVVTLGALLADTPHTRPIPVTGTVSDSALARRMRLDESEYEGPTGINGVFADMCSRSQIPHASLWAAVPHYVAQPPCPKATLALLGRLEDLMGTGLPLGDLVEEAQAWSRGVEELTSEDTEIAEYVEALESARDTSELPEASGDEIAREFERYLRRRTRDGDD